MTVHSAVAIKSPMAIIILGVRMMKREFEMGAARSYSGRTISSQAAGWKEWIASEFGRFGQEYSSVKDFLEQK